MSARFATYSLQSETKSEILKVIDTETTTTFYYPCQSTYSCQPYNIQLSKGIYKFEAWAPFSRDNLGSYVSGVIKLKNSTSFLVYVGGKSYQGHGGYNGGGDSTHGNSNAGAGATDIRLDTSLNSRIMVAAGSGGYDGDGSGPAGTDVGKSCSNTRCGGGGTQTSGGKGTPAGSFGQGGSDSSIDGGGGGGGYWGGGHGGSGFGGGGGGSSFVSGHPHCNAVVSASSIAPSGTPIHYSKLVFESPVMIGATEGIPDPDDPTKLLTLDRQMNGVFRVTLLDEPKEHKLVKLPIAVVAAFESFI